MEHTGCRPAVCQGYRTLHPSHTLTLWSISMHKISASLHSYHNQTHTFVSCFFHHQTCSWSKNSFISQHPDAASHVIACHRHTSSYSKIVLTTPICPSSPSKCRPQIAKSGSKSTAQNIVESTPTPIPGGGSHAVVNPRQFWEAAVTPFFDPSQFREAAATPSSNPRQFWEAAAPPQNPSRIIQPPTGRPAEVTGQQGGPRCQQNHLPHQVNRG